MKTRHLPLLQGAFIGALAFGLASCSPQAPRGPRDDIVIGVQLEPPGLDPTAGAAAAIDEVVYANVFEGLTRIDENGAVVPGLADSWEVSADGRSLTFRLRSGVTFHDGTTFDAEDVKFTLDRARAEGSLNAQRALFAPIERVEVLAADRVAVHLAYPVGGFLYHLGFGDAVIVAPESAEANATNPVGTGPFRFKEWRKGDKIALERFEGYWGAPAPLNAAVFRVIADPSAAYAALLSGDVDAFPNYPAPENLPALEKDKRFSVVVGSTEGETILAINNQKAPFSDVRVRRALAHAVDKAAIIEAAMFGYGVPIGSHFPPHDKDYVDLTGLYPHSPEEARRLLAEAGFASGLKARLALPPPSYARRGGEIIEAQMRAVGVELEIEQLEWAQWLQQVFAAKDFDLTIVAHTEPADIDIYARDDYYFGYRRAEFRALMARLGATGDAAERSALLEDAQRMIAEDAVNVFLFQIPKLGVADRRIEGLWRDSPVQANDLTRVRWTDE